MVDKRIAVLGIGLVIISLVAAFLFVSSGEPSPTEIGQMMEERYDEVQDYEGTLTVSMIQARERTDIVNETAISEQAQVLAAENESLSVEEAEERIRESLPESGTVEIFNHTTVADVTFAKPDRYRYDYVQQPPDPRVGTLTAEGNTATVYRKGYDPEERELGTGDVPLVGLRMGDYVPTITDDYEIELNRTTEDVYVLDLTPVTDFEGAIDRILVDREEMLPVRVERAEVSPSTGVETETVVEYEYEYGTGVSPSVFNPEETEIDYPETETDPRDEEPSRVQEIRQNISQRAREEGLWEVENVTRESFSFESVDEGQDWFGRAVPKLDTSESGYRVSSVRGNTVDGNSSMTLAYRNSTNNFNVYYTSQRESRFADWPGDDHDIFTVEEVQVGDNTGELHYYEIESGYGRSVVRYSCDGLLIEAYTDNLSNDNLLSLADSIGCGV